MVPARRLTATRLPRLQLRAPPLTSAHPRSRLRPALASARLHSSPLAASAPLATGLPFVTRPSLAALRDYRGSPMPGLTTGRADGPSHHGFTSSIRCDAPKSTVCSAEAQTRLVGQWQSSPMVAESALCRRLKTPSPFCQEAMPCDLRRTVARFARPLATRPPTPCRLAKHRQSRRQTSRTRCAAHGIPANAAVAMQQRSTVPVRLRRRPPALGLRPSL
ncbi:hypothetical protein PEP31012_01344 [Pandoraea eparura]|uniref:Uncharacterized protein n=1 Tax=Pandoraea eparura TaxID=2508291 RepID=A0A5E4TDC2_9BURK|nr:hypothetical protein PEP31012_01344 [Pandoraea eparura]